MATLEGLVSAVKQDVDLAVAKAAHSTYRPVDGVSHFRVSLRSGAMAAGITSNSDVFQFRWWDPSKIAIIHRIEFTGMRATTAFAAGVINFALLPAYLWSGDGSGGATATLTSPSMKLRNDLPTTHSGTIRIATTAALGAGTKTFGAHAIDRVNANASAGDNIATPIVGNIKLPKLTLFKHDQMKGEHPLVLRADSAASGPEGIALLVAVPATGVWNFGITMAWSEVNLY